MFTNKERNLTPSKTVEFLVLLLLALLLWMTATQKSFAQESSENGNIAEQFIQDFIDEDSGAAQEEPEMFDSEMAPTPAPTMNEPAAQTDQETLLPVPADTPASPAQQADTPPNLLEQAQPSGNQEDTVIPVEVTDQAPPSEEEFAIPTIPAVPPAPDPDEGLFYDSESYVPQGQIATKGAVRKVSPRTEPGSKLVVVKKNYSGGSRQARAVSAQRALKLGRYESALDLYNELYATSRRDPAILMGRAVALQKLDRDDAAVQAYEELLDVQPDNTEARVNMLGIMGQRYPSVARQRLMNLQKDNPTDVSILAQLAVVEANVGRYDQALRHLGVASGLQPQNASHIFNMAVIADRAGDKKAAIKYYEQALEVDAIHGSSRTVPRESIFSRLAQLR